MSQNGLFSRRYDVAPEMLLDFLQQAMAGMPTITSYELADSGDRINFTTSFTWTSWGENMVAAVESDGPDRSVLTVSGEPRVGLLSTPWGEEMHAATIESQLFSALDPSIEMARTNPIVMLQADHRRVEALFARIQATDDGERAELVQQLLLALRVHMELEENHVYPLLGREVDPDLAEEAEVEHQLARDGLAQLEELTPDEPGFDGALVMVMAGIEHHVMEEESDAFPRLASELGPDRLTELAQQLTSVRAGLLEQVHNPEQSKDESKPDQSSVRKQPRPPRPKQKTDRTRTSRSQRKRAKINPDETTRADLQQQAKKAGVSGYSHMSKRELASAITRAK
jgi:hemerythrin-like domain-containing protein